MADETTGFLERDHEEFRSPVREFVEREVAPHQERWEDEQRIDPKLWLTAGRQGLLGLAAPVEFGGGGMADYRFRCVLIEELARVGASSVNAAVSLLDDLVGPYLFDLATPGQKARWLPGLLSGERTAAIAMTEPGAGSDLQGIRTTARPAGDGWILNGSKTFITNGAHADLLIVVAATGFDDDGTPLRASRRFSLLVVEADMAGFTRGRPIDTLGQRAEGVAELFFDDVEVPAANVLGELGHGFGHLMERLPTERMSIAYYALAAAEQALAWTLEFTRDRSAFGRRVVDFQASRFALAEMSTELDVTRAYLERSVLQLNSGALSATGAAKAKWWSTELLQRIATRCLQLHGGYGYVREYPIARLFVDARVQTIYGGTTEIMKEIIGRQLADVGPSRAEPIRPKQ